MSKQYIPGIDCRCVAQVDDDGTGHLSLCSLHKAAKPLLEACKLAWRLLDDAFVSSHPGFEEMLRRVIKEAEEDS